MLAEKGYCGTSGVAANAGPGHWWVPPDPTLRAQAVARRADAGLGRADPHWMERVLDTTWQTLPTLARHYDFPTDEHGVVQYRALRGPEYLRALRGQALQAGVTILDHTPALTLLCHTDRSVAGATLYRRRTGEALEIRSGAVILATGGGAFRSPLLGSGNLTGDGLLMAAEAGASLSAMEFTGYCTVAPAGTFDELCLRDLFRRGGPRVVGAPGPGRHKRPRGCFDPRTGFLPSRPHARRYPRHAAAGFPQRHPGV
jgi:hypothetical protein